MKSHAELTKRQLQVLPYLLPCPSYEEAARQAHVRSNHWIERSSGSYWVVSEGLKK